MGRLLGQLACVGCAHRFWPTENESAMPLVLCPRCGAGHANGEALVHRYAHGPHLSPPVVDWMGRFWLDLPPRVGAFTTPMTQVTRVESGVRDGYPWCLAAVRSMDGAVAAGTFVMVAATPPSARAALPPGCSWAAAGIWAFGGSSFDLVRDELLPTIVAQLRASRASPLHAISEVDDPDPLDPAAAAAELGVADDPAADIAVESRALRCTECGAPSSLAELLGDARCPYCAAQQTLPPELAQELAAYQRRVRAAVLRSSTDLVPAMLRGAPSSPPARSGSVGMACVHCGASNLHVPGALDEHCTSCRSPLVPSRSVIARGVAAGARAALQDHASQAAEHARTVVGWQASTSAAAVALACLVGGGMLMPGLVFSVLSVRQLLERNAGAGALLALVALVCLAGALGLPLWLLGRSRALSSRWQPRFAALAEQLGATRVGTARDLAAWGARWWRDRLANDWLVSGPAHGALDLQIGGFPMAITVNVESSGSPFAQGRPHAAILLAAALPRDVRYWARRDEAVRVVGALERLGFHLELRTGGLVLQADAPTVASTRAAPDRIAMLAPVAFALAHLAHHLRGQPPR